MSNIALEELQNLAEELEDPEEQRKREEQEMAERRDIGKCLRTTKTVQIFFLARDAMQEHLEQLKRIRIALIRRHSEAVRDNQRTQAKLSDQAVERLDRVCTHHFYPQANGTLYTNKG